VIVPSFDWQLRFNSSGAPRHTPQFHPTQLQPETTSNQPTNRVPITFAVPIQVNSYSSLPHSPFQASLISPPSSIPSSSTRPTTNKPAKWSNAPTSPRH
jgi:hypothetical protein